MKKNWIAKAFGLTLAVMSMSAVIWAQGDKASRPSPPATATGKVNGANITINYSSPSVKGRQILCTGFIAQEVQKAAKDIGYDFSGVDAPKNENDLYGLRYAEFVVPLVKAVQELSAKNDAKDAEINDLRTRLAKLEAMMNVQQSAVSKN